MVSTTSSFISLSVSLSDDNVTRLSDVNIPFYEMNIRCVSNPVYYGDGTIMDDYLNIGDVASYRNVNLRDIFIKNYTAGSNGQVIITGSIPNYLTKDKLGL